MATTEPRKATIIRPHLRESIGGCRVITLKELRAHVNRMFEQSDKALFEAAEKSGDASAQNRYFDAMRELSSRRDAVESRFRDELAGRYDDFTAGIIAAGARAEAPPDSAGGLSLVDPEAFEESLAISTMISKAEGRFSDQLHALNQRMSILNAGARIDNATNPSGPASIAECFRIAITALDLEGSVRQVVYSWFDVYVMSRLGSTFDALNERLVAAKVLPGLDVTPASYASARHASTGTGQGSSERPQQAAEDGSSEELDLPAGDGSAAIQPGVPATKMSPPLPSGPLTSVETQRVNELFLAARALSVAGRLVGTAGAVPNSVGIRSHIPTAATVDSAPALSTADLIAALDSVQQDTVVVTPGPGVAPQTRASTAGRISAHIGRLPGGRERRKRLSGPDADTIDLVGSIFDVMLNDPNQSSSVKALLSHLHTPFIKVAFLDKRFFTQAQHPARRLLDAMCKAGAHWVMEGDSGGPVLPKMEQVVQRVLGEFRNDLGLFAELYIEFTDFIAQVHKRALVTEKRAIAASKGREKLAAARQRAAAEIRKRLEGHEVPDALHNFLVQPWSHYLAFQMLREGSSAQAEGALRTGEHLIHCMEHARSESGDPLEVLLALLEEVRSGLTIIGYHHGDIETTLRELRGCLDRTDDAPVADQARDRSPSAPEVPVATQTLATSAAAPPAEDSDGQPDAPSASVPVSGMPSVAPAPMPSPETDLPEEDRRWVQQLREVKFGTWFNLTDPQNGSVQRVKLAWFSPVTSNYMLVNKMGVQVAVRSCAELARAMRIGHASIEQTKDRPFVERALLAICDSFRPSAGASA